MRKWVKGFLIAAAAFILLGLIFCIGGVAAGGDSAAKNIVNSLANVYSGMEEVNFVAHHVKSLEIRVGTAEVEIIENDSLVFSMMEKSQESVM